MTTNTTTVSRRLLSIGAAATLASAGAIALSAPAQAADANSKVWVCKYVRAPGSTEVLKGGKNPIRVSGHSVDKDKDGQVFVGDQFADAQGRSVIIQIGGSDPGRATCSPTPPHVRPPHVRPPHHTPGTGAPDTGGDSSGLPYGLLGGGVLLAGAGALAVEAQRRRREAALRP